jgi:AcrR family transcriptional regulator
MSQPNRRSRQSVTQRENTRQKIVEAAMQLFREKGYDGVSMNELARAVGISAAGLYWHFHNKAEILAETLEGELLELIHRTGKSAEGSTAEERLWRFTREHVLFNLERLDVAKLFGAASFGFPQLISSLSEPGRERLVRLERQHMENLTRVLRDGMTSGEFDIRDPMATAFAVLAPGEHAVYWFRSDGRMTPQELAELYADFAVRMVRQQA